MLPSREALHATTPPAYRWPVHVGLIVAFTLAGAAVCRQALGPLAIDDAGWLVASFLATNLGEYCAHRWPLHHRMFPRQVYERHVQEHHAFFPDDRTAIDTWSQIRWVLFPPWALPLLVLTVFPVAFGLGVVAGHRAAWLLVLVVIAYYGLYELLHALAHLPAQAPVARSRIVRALTHHHRVHHQLALMGHWNFNFAIPLFDLLFGTIHHARDGGPPSEPAVAPSRPPR